MAIKSTTSNDPCEKKELPYPKLMTREGTGLIVLMSGNGKGTVIKETSLSRAVGAFSNDLDPSYFTDYVGTVHLTNEE